MDANKGPKRSRRSHTKSKSGCATCKRRHIRCDETFPQCRNCTKHGVECDHRQNINQMAPQSYTVGQRTDGLTAHGSPSSTSSEWDTVQPNATAQSFGDAAGLETAYSMYGYGEATNYQRPLMPQYAVYQPSLQGHQMDAIWQNQVPLTPDLYPQQSLSNDGRYNSQTPFHTPQEYPMSYGIDGHSMHYWSGAAL